MWLSNASRPLDVPLMDVDIPYQMGPAEKEPWIGHFMFYWFELAILHAIAVENAKTAVDA